MISHKHKAIFPRNYTSDIEMLGYETEE
jgi:hypothetical protein